MVGSLGETSVRATWIRDCLIDKCLVVHTRVSLVKIVTTLLMGKNYSEPGRPSESSRMCLKALTKYLVASCCPLSISCSSHMSQVSLITSAAHYYLSKFEHGLRNACQDE
jgi:hypothetical protein